MYRWLLITLVHSYYMVFPAELLNACRHRRDHHDEVRGVSPLASACSTPVGIEGIITSQAGGELQRISVLNACRHRRDHHLGVRGDLGKQHDVLNACRHRRDNHSSLPLSSMFDVVSAQRLSVSKGSSRRPWLQAGQRAKVLNACRHRRDHHSSSPLMGMFARACSTPVGIEGIITIPDHRTMERRLSAQRLSASKGSSLDFSVTHRSVQPSAQRLPRCHCAQRLSASKGSSRLNRPQ